MLEHHAGTKQAERNKQRAEGEGKKLQLSRIVIQKGGRGGVRQIEFVSMQEERQICTLGGLDPVRRVAVL